jgi:type III secretion protein D
VTFLRILNGLKRGASLPLQEGNLLIGASFSNDIVMLDQGIADQHFEIKRNISDLEALLGDDLDIDSTTASTTPDEEFILQPVNGNVTRIDGTITKNSFLLQKNQPFLVGDIWFVIHDKDTAWPEKLPRIQVKATVTELQSGKKTLIKQILDMHPAMLAGVFSVACFMFLGFRNLSYATTSEQASDQVSEELKELRKEFKAKNLTAMVASSELEPSIDGNEVIGQKALNSNVNDPASTKIALLKMINDREIDGVEVEESESSLILNGEISAQNKDKLARMLERYRYENSTSIAVVDSTVVTTLKLPFEIKSVVSGPYSHVRLGDGHKLQVGETLSGYTLTSISERTIVFTGKNKIEVNW